MGMLIIAFVWLVIAMITFAVLYAASSIFGIEGEHLACRWDDDRLRLGEH